MCIEQIGQILEIVECGSIGKAAQKLYMQQPNLSMAVKAVEEEFHQPIFYRTPNGVCLTPFGKDFLAFAEPYYKQYQVLKELGENSASAPIEEFHVCSHHMTIALLGIFTNYAETIRVMTVHLHMNNIPLKYSKKCSLA